MDRAALATLPAEPRQELVDALARLDTKRIDALIGRIMERDATLARTLRRLAANFDYGPVEEALRSESKTGAAARCPA